MQAFNNDPQLKQRFVAQLSLSRAERKAIENTTELPLSILEMPAEKYEQQIGIPRALAALLEHFDRWDAKSEEMELMAKFLDAIEPGRDISDIVPRFVQLILTSPDGMLVDANPQISELAQQVLAGHAAKWNAKEWRMLRRHISAVREVQVDPLQKGLAGIVEALAWDIATTQTIGADALYQQQECVKYRAQKAFNFTPEDREYELGFAARWSQVAKANNVASPEQAAALRGEFSASEMEHYPVLYQRYYEIKALIKEYAQEQGKIHRNLLLSIM